MAPHPIAMAEKHRAVRRQLFPEKLWELVNKPASGIQWSPDGKRIEVERSQLEKFIGTKFRSQNFDSFIRQLHFYGFRKCGNSYHHEKFQRGRPEALLTMRRKYSNFTFNQISRAEINSESPPACYNTSSSGSDSLSPSNNEHSSTLSNLMSIVQQNYVPDASLHNRSTLDLVQHVVDDNDRAIDYSKKRKPSPIKPIQATQQTITNFMHDTNEDDYDDFGDNIELDRMEKQDSSTRTEDIMMYLLEPKSSTSPMAQPLLGGDKAMQSFSKIRASRAQAVVDKDTVSISLKDVTKNLQSGVTLPMTLILNKMPVGGQTLLSAYFVYKTEGGSS